MPGLKKLFLILVLLITIQINSNGDTNNIGSYESDTAHANRCLDKASDLLFVNTDSAHKYIDTAFIISQRINYEKGIYKSYNLRGYLFFVTNELHKALVQYKNALKYAQSNRKKAIVMSNIGLVYSNLFMTDSCEHYLFRTIKFSSENNIIDMHAKAMFDLSNLYIEQGNYVEAVKYLLKTRDELKNFDNPQLLMYVYSLFGLLYSNIGMFSESLLNYNNAMDIAINNDMEYSIAGIYINIGQLYFDQKQEYDSAKYYFHKAISSAVPSYKNVVELNANINIGNIYYAKQQFDSAYLYYQKAYNDTLIDRYPGSKAALLVNLGSYYLKKKNIEKARYFLNKGYLMTDTLNQLLYKINALTSLSKLDSMVGDYKQSREYYVEYHILSDSLQSDEAQQKIAALEFEQYIEREKYNNQLLTKENKTKSIMIWVTVGTVLILLIFITILYLNRTRIKNLLEQLSHKHQDLQVLNEELIVTNETLIAHQEQLRELNISKDKFFSILGHDLKSPFNGLLGILSLLTEDWDIINDIEKRKILQSLFTSSKKTYTLLEDMLRWAKTQQGLIKYNPEIFHIYPNIIEIENLLKAQLDSKEQKLAIKVSTDIEFKSDSRLFMHIIQNLLNNAIKFTPVGGNITISAEVNKNILEVSIIDNGIGIPEEEISKIFDIDSNFKRAGTKGEISSGMGLLLSNEYARIINAKLSVTSIEGKGSTFKLLIPPTF